MEYVLQLGLFLYVFLMVLDGGVNGLIHTLRPGSIICCSSESSDWERASS
jgi:hypothetical protein